MRRSRGRTLLLLGIVGLAVWIVGSLATRTPPANPAGPDAPDTREAVDPELQGRGPQDATMPDPVPEEHAAIEGGMTIVGRVLDGATFRAAANAQVAVHCPDRAAIESVTRADGTFHVAFGLRPLAELDAALRVRTGDDQGVTAIAPIAPLGDDVVDVGTLLLRATTTLLVKTVHAGKPVAGATVHASSQPRRLRVHRGQRPDRAWPGHAHRAVSDASGLARIEELPRGAVRVLALAEGPLRGERLLTAEEAETPVEVSLEVARDLRVEVVWKDSGVPIPGCPLAISARDEALHDPGSRPTTNAAGIAVVPNVPDDVTLRVIVVGDEWCSAYLKGVEKEVEPGVAELRVEIPSPILLRFPIVAEDGPFPDDGTRVALEQERWGFWPGTRIGLAREGVVEGGELVVGFYRIFWERAFARLPDGRVGRLQLAVDYDRKARASKPRLPHEPVVFQEPRTVRVTVTERGGGNPAADVAVRVFLNRGNMTLPSVRTNADGVATISGLPALEGWVAVCANPTWIRPSRHGVFSQRTDIDLAEGDANLHFDVAPVEEGVITVTTDGRAGFPRGLRVGFWHIPEGLAFRSPRDVAFDAERSEVSFRMRPPIPEATPPVKLAHRAGALLVRLTSDTHGTEVVRFEAGEPLQAVVDLSPAGTLVTRVLKPRGMAFSAELEVHVAKSEWTRVFEGFVLPYEDDEEGDRYEGLKPGRYRLHAKNIGWVSEAVEVGPAPTPTHLVWDVTRVGFAEGEVVLPPGVDPKGLSIFVLEAEGPPRIVASAKVEDPTDFRVQVPGDRPVTLKPVHRECQPDPEEGSVTITRPEKGLRLRMIPREP